MEMITKTRQAALLGLTLLAFSPTVLPTQLFAATATASSKQARKDATTLKSLIKLLDRAETQQDKNIRTAASSIKSAVKSYKKLSEEFQKNEEVIELKAKLDRLLPIIERKELEGKKVAANKKATDSLTKLIERLEKEVKSENFSRASRSSKSVKRAYDKLSDDLKSTESISKLKTKMDLLITETEAKVAISNQHEEDTRNIKNLEKYINSAAKAIDSGKWVDAGRPGRNALKIYEDISVNGKKKTEVVALKEKLDKIVEQYDAAYEADEAATKQRSGIMKESFEISNLYQKHWKYFDLQQKGKSQKEIKNEGMKDLVRLKENEKLGAALWTEIEKKFPLTVASQEIKQESDFSIMKELLANRVKYRDNYIKLVCGNILDKKIEHTKEIMSKLNKEGKIFAVNLKELYGDLKSQPFEEVQAVTPYYNWIGTVGPQDKLKQLNDFKAACRKKLESLADDNSFDDDSYDYTNNHIEKTAKEFAKRNDFKFIEVAQKGSNDWTIVKNSLGIPTHRYASGFVVLQKDGEPFKRGYKAGMHQQYQGGGRYDKVGSIKLAIDFFPIK